MKGFLTPKLVAKIALPLLMLIVVIGFPLFVFGNTGRGAHAAPPHDTSPHQGSNPQEEQPVAVDQTPPWSASSVPAEPGQVPGLQAQYTVPLTAVDANTYAREKAAAVTGPAPTGAKLLAVPQVASICRWAYPVGHHLPPLVRRQSL